MPGTQRAPGTTRGPRKDKANHGIGQFLSKPWWLGIGAIAAVIAIGGAVAAVLAILPTDQHATQGVKHSSASSTMLSEQHMISLLIAGDNYARLQQIIGVEPDLQQAFKSGTTLYQFNRTWEYIDLLVKGGRVLSVGVYARSPSFKPVLDADGFFVTVNGSSIVRQTRYSDAIGAVGNCGPSDIGASFFEGFSLPMANEQSSIILGWVDLGSMPIPQSACAAVFFAQGLHPAKCDELDDFKQLSSEFLGCLNNSKTGQAISGLGPAVAIVTAPHQPVLPEMFDYAPLSVGTGLAGLASQ